MIDDFILEKKYEIKTGDEEYFYLMKVNHLVTDDMETVK
jgi:hypothetical protein